LSGLGATYYDHLRLIGKRVVDFLLVLTGWWFTVQISMGPKINVGSRDLRL